MKDKEGIVVENKLKNLLMAVDQIVSKYPSSEKHEDSMNLFRILEIQRREVYLCRVLAKLIDPMSHDKGSAFLKLFFDQVLSLSITLSECQKTAVYTEYVIDDKRRIDIYIQSEKYNVPIEAKVDAGDQKAQLLDYSHYAKNAQVYYLTLDGHLPSEYSIANEAEDGGRLREQDYCCISFLQHIISWIDACLLICEDTSSTETVLRQLKDILVENIKEQRDEIAMGIAQELINNAENFRLATAIAEGLQEAKIQKMQQFLSAIAEELAEYGAIAADKKSVTTYYNQKSSTWPGVVIPLSVNGNRNFALRIEIDHRLYYGVCNYCKEATPYFNDHTCMDESEEAKQRREFVSKYLMPKTTKNLNSSKSFYWWRYLPSDLEKSSSKDLNFQDCTKAYVDLYDPEKLDSAVEIICKMVKDFLGSVGHQP